MTTTPPSTPERLAVGWCHSCGTLQLQVEMPTATFPWEDGPVPACVECGEPWGMGVWPKGEHLPECPSVQVARDRVVDWAPALEECTCGAAPSIG